MGVAGIILGIAGFVLFALYDRFSLKKSRPALFVLGGLLLAAGEALLLLQGVNFTGRPALSIFGALIGLAGLAGLAHSLFFVLPKGAYSGGAEVCAKGLYRLCRHPGAWCFMIFQAGVLMLGFNAFGAMAFALFNTCELTLVWCEDRYIFPRTLREYDEYKRQVPFMFIKLRK